MNLPNKISLTRILLIPVVIFFYLSDLIPAGKLIALSVFVIAAFTDFVDGYIARKFNLVTNLGKYLDTIADKLLILTGILLVTCDGTILMPYGVIAAIIILGREFLVSAFRQIAATKGLVMAADKLGKLKAVFQDITVTLFMFIAGMRGNFSPEVTDRFTLAALILLGISVLLTIVSGINYFVKNRKVLS